MKYKILKGTCTYDKLISLQDKIKQCNQAAYVLVEEMGATRYINNSGIYSLAGGISGIQLDVKPVGWCLAYPKVYNNIYIPIRNRIANQEIIKRIDSLPLVTTEELNVIVGFKDQKIGNPGGSSTWILAPQIFYKNDLVLMKVKEGAKYKPPSNDIIEITVSEYLALEAAENNVAS